MRPAVILHRSRPWPRLRLAWLLLGVLLPGWPALAEGPAPIRLKIVGGLGGVPQYTQFEAPFWLRRVPELTGGRIQAEIAPFDASGIRGQEMLQLLRLGVVSFGDVLLALAAADEPELNAVDLPALSPDIGALRRTVALWRPRLEAILRDRYGVELLTVFAYPAQVVFCNRPFSGLAGLAGRRVRTSSVGQSELIERVGGTPVVVPFAEQVQAIRAGVVECAITGAASGNAIGLQDVTSHVSSLAISWGVSVFATNPGAWGAIPEPMRLILREGLAQLEREVWDDAAQQTEDGLACNAGRADCRGGRPGRMVIVEESWEDEARRRELLRDHILPSWVNRCGAECAESWNRYMAEALGVRARASD
jgi:TRAP-type C4-dicarboxylate transport system substrate-binding protein